MLEEIGIKAKQASLEIALLTSDQKDLALIQLAKLIQKNKDYIIKENQKDLSLARKNNLSEALIDRLLLTEDRIFQISKGLQNLTELDDPIGKTLEIISPENGLIIEKRTVPLGVVGIIYESRPNVTVDAFALTFKSGNAVILKGGKEAIHTNLALEKIIHENLNNCDINPFAMQLVPYTTREATNALMKMREYVDVLIPRGSAGLIKAVVDNSRIPVIETGAGNCHLYIDKSANIDMAISIIENAKCQRLGVCNALESLVVHEDIADFIIKKIYTVMHDVKIYGDVEAQKTDDRVLPASDSDFYKEYLDKSLSLKIVRNISEAIAHINKYNTGHSDGIISESDENIERFLNEIDSSTVYVNASTRFTDGFEFGFGAEIGISTQKLHARGPMGLESLCSYKYIVKGKGQIRE